MKDTGSPFSVLDRDRSPQPKLLTIEEIATQLGQSEDDVRRAIKALSLDTETVSVATRSNLGVVKIIKKKGSKDIAKIREFFDLAVQKIRKSDFKKITLESIKSQDKFGLMDEFSSHSVWDLSLMEEFFTTHGLNKRGTDFRAFLQKYIDNNPDLKDDISHKEGVTLYPSHVFNRIREAYVSEVANFIDSYCWVSQDDALDPSESNNHFIGLDKKIFRRILKQILEEDPTFNDDLRVGSYGSLKNNTSKIKSEVYSPRLILEIKRRIQLSQAPLKPRDWVELHLFTSTASRRLANTLGIEVTDLFKKMVAREIHEYVRQEIRFRNPKAYEIYKTYRTLPLEMYEEIYNEIFGGEPLRDGWVLWVYLANEIEGNYPGLDVVDLVKDELDQMIKDGPSVKDEIQEKVLYMPKDSNNVYRTRAYSPRLASEIVKIAKVKLEQKRIQDTKKYEETLSKLERDRAMLKEKQRVSEAEKEIERTKKSLESFLTAVSEISEETLDFRRLIGLFGTGSTLDLLYAFHPEYKKLPVDYVKSQLAKCLGDFMVVRTGNVLDEVELALPFLGEKSLQDSLFVVLKEDAINYYQTEKRKNKERDDNEILDKYLLLLQNKAIILNNTEFTDVFERVQAYVQSLCHDFHKPDNIVDEINQGRTFPDLNQKINIKEIRDEKRVLIGDEMGMGKSASAILAKEYLGLGVALVVVPSNVTSTWHRYLSDAVGPDGRPSGYFKAGQAPRVLEVNSLDDIALITGGEYDYVVISHEKFKEEYAEKLKDSPIEMVIIDEVHKFKNVTQGKRSKALFEFMQYLKDEELYTVLLSGTPVPNKIKDLAVTLKLLYPDEFGEMDSSVLVTSIIKGDNINLRDLLFKKTQMKKLVDSVEMPNKSEREIFIDFSEEERELYELLLEDDELTATEKLQKLRQFCLNPRKVFPDLEIESSKVKEARSTLMNHFETKDKVVMFVNGYIDGIVRGDNSILEQLRLPSDIQVMIIDGNVAKDERAQIEQRLKYMVEGKVLLVLSGMAADVGVDFSSAEAVYFYNEPWTKFDKMQQQARVYRPGLAHDITVDTSLISGSVEEGIHYYLEMKYRAVLKLLEGVPLSEIEQSMLLFEEKVGEGKIIDGDQGLAEEWLRSPANRLLKFFGSTKEIGEAKFMGFLKKYGQEYADYYADMGTRGFQANTARFVTALIEKYRIDKKIDGPITILDVASGPEMLAKKVSDEEKDNIFSLDINPAHFKVGSGRQVVAGFKSLPIRESSVDLLNMSLAIHYSAYRPSKGEFERLEVLGEMARVLKVGGRAVINLVYSQEWKNRDKLRQLLERLGLKVVEECTGRATAGNRFVSECLTFEKIQEVDIQKEFNNLKGGERALLDGLKLLTKVKTKLEKSKDIVWEFVLNGETISVKLNDEDIRLLTEQEQLRNEGAQLMDLYGSAETIPKTELLGRSMRRYASEGKSRLVKKGAVSKAFIHVN